METNLEKDNKENSPLRKVRKRIQMMVESVVVAIISRFMPSIFNH